MIGTNESVYGESAYNLHLRARQLEKKSQQNMERAYENYQTIQRPFIETEMPALVTRILWAMGQSIQKFEGQPERKINDEALHELLKLVKGFTELMPAVSVSTSQSNFYITPEDFERVNKNAFQEDFYLKIEPLFKEIWLKVMESDTLDHIFKNCPVAEKQAFLEKFKAETCACQSFQPEERNQLDEFIEKVYALIYEDKRTF